MEKARSAFNVNLDWHLGLPNGGGWGGGSHGRDVGGREVVVIGVAIGRVLSIKVGPFVM